MSKYRIEIPEGGVHLTKEECEHINALFNDFPFSGGVNVITLIGENEGESAASVIGNNLFNLSERVSEHVIEADKTKDALRRLRGALAELKWLIGYIGELK